jgi:hypothetical protein
VTGQSFSLGEQSVQPLTFRSVLAGLLQHHTAIEFDRHQHMVDSIVGFCRPSNLDPQHHELHMNLHQSLKSPEGASTWECSHYNALMCLRSHMKYLCRSICSTCSTRWERSVRWVKIVLRLHEHVKFGRAWAGYWCRKCFEFSCQVRIILFSSSSVFSPQ